MIESFLTGVCVGGLLGVLATCVLASSKKMTEEEAERYYEERRQARIRALLNGGRDLQ